MKTLIQRFFVFLLICFAVFSELSAQDISINGVDLDSAELNWKYIRDGYAPYLAQTKENARQINYKKTDTIRINYGENTELIVSQKEEVTKLFQNSKSTNQVDLANNKQEKLKIKEETTVNYTSNELSFEIPQIDADRVYTKSEKVQIAVLRKELLAVTRQYHALAHKKSQIKKRKNESKNRFIGNSVQWHDTCLNKNGFFFYFPPTHIAQKLYQLGASIRSGISMTGKNKKIAKLKTKQENIKAQIKEI